MMIDCGIMNIALNGLNILLKLVKRGIYSVQNKVG